MNKIQRTINSFNKFQQRHAVIGFPVAVLKKYGDDAAGNQAALITYFGFVSLFPLLLVLFSTLNFLTNHNEKIEHRVASATLHYFPVSAQEIYSNIHSVHGSGLGIVMVLLITLYGARGIASALQNASNKLWLIPKKDRPDFWHTTARSLGIIVLGGGGMIVTTLAISYANNISSKGFIFKILATLFALVLNVLVFTVVFRFATVKTIETRWLINGAIVAAVFWQILQYVGGFLVLHQLKRSTEFYGVFALVLGMLFWIYLQAEVTLYAIEINVVRMKKMWPRDIT